MLLNPHLIFGTINCKQKKMKMLYKVAYRSRVTKSHKICLKCSSIVHSEVWSDDENFTLCSFFSLFQRAGFMANLWQAMHPAELLSPGRFPAQQQPHHLKCPRTLSDFLDNLFALYNWHYFLDHRIWSYSWQLCSWCINGILVALLEHKGSEWNALIQKMNNFLCGHWEHNGGEWNALMQKMNNLLCQHFTDGQMFVSNRWHPVVSLTLGT